MAGVSTISAGSEGAVFLNGAALNHELHSEATAVLNPGSGHDHATTDHEPSHLANLVFHQETLFGELLPTVA